MDVTTIPVNEYVILINDQFADTQDRYLDLHVSELDGNLLSINFPRDLYRSKVLENTTTGSLGVACTLSLGIGLMMVWSGNSSSASTQ